MPLASHPDPVRPELKTDPRTEGSATSLAEFAGLLTNRNQLTGAAVWDRRPNRTGRPARTTR